MQDRLYNSRKYVNRQLKCLFCNIKSRKGFSILELMITILIAIILATVAVQLFRRSVVDAAKWSEAKAMMGTVASAVRAYVAERDQPPSSGAFDNWGIQLGFHPGDFAGNYFSSDDITIDSVIYDQNESPALQFLIKGENIHLSPGWYKLDHDGQWTFED